ncbi:MAG: hypothetical protein IJZ35_09370 [Clostridia bacterium]|nr:hypothetical protein [Clostridia bacterium]
MKIAKKTLSVFLSFLMVFTSCYVGLFGVTSFAAPGDSKYTHDEVVDLIEAAIADGYSAKSSGNATNITGDNGSILAAAEAIFDYAVKTYREGRKADSANNSGDTLLAAFAAEFAADFPDAADANAAYALATDVLNPNGTTLYGYPTTVAGTTLTEKSSTWTTANFGVNPKRTAGDNSDADWIQAYYSSSVKEVTKTVAVEVDVDKFLQSYDSIEDIPSSFLTSVSYTYAHAIGKQATTTNSEKNDGKFIAWRTYWYESVTTTKSWNYMSAKPVRVVVKNTTAKKYLKSIDKFFNADRLALTLDDLLAMSLADLEYLNTQADGFRTMMNENFSAATLTHFGFAPDKINTLIDNINFAYNVVAGMAAIDTLNNYIGSEYNVDSYAEMASLYAKVSSAYNVVDTMQDSVLDYILNEYDYTDEYASVDMAASKAYIDELHAIMTEQRLEELVASMTAKYNEYYSLLDKENIVKPTDDEITHLVSQVASWNEILATYTGYDYYRTYYTTDHEAAWNDFCAKLNEVAEVRGLKADYKDFYDWFYYLLYTTEISDASDDQLMEIYEEAETRLGELRDKYNEIVAKYGNYTIADKIFTINYEGSDYLLQTLIENSKTAGYAAIKAELVDRAEADLDAVMVYSGVTVVNFDNFAEIKSTLSHFNYDLYDYVTGDNREGTNWLSNDYVTKYSQVQTLLDKYHAFSTTDGKQFFNENFTYADANGLYATRYAGNQTAEVVGEDEDGNPVTATKQIGYPNDIARDNEDKNNDGKADDNYYVDEAVLLSTVTRIDNFITSRDFGALLNLVDTETEEATDLKTYVNQMLAEMLYTDEMMNTLVGAIFPMVCELIEEELIGAIGTMDGATVDENGVPWLDLNELAGISGDLALYLDTTYAPSHDGGNQKDFPTLFAELGLYIYPSTLADSLAVSNPSFYGKESDIYKALKAAGRDWSQLVCEDDPETLNVDETKALEFVWGVYDQDSFFDAVACVLDSLLPLLQAVLTNAGYSEEVSNAAIAYSPELLTVDDVFIRGGLELTIDPLNAYSTLLKPLFQVLGVTNIPNLSSSCDGSDIVNAIFGTLLKRVDEILDAPLDSILSILPNLVYFLSMDSVQEIIDGLNIKLNLNIHEVEVIDFSGLLGYLLDGIDGILADKINFDINLAIADMLDLYDLLGFEITNFNEVLEFLLPTLGLDVKLPPIKQQEIIFCSDWTTRADGSVNLVANKGDLLYWLLDYIVSAIADGTLIDALLGDTEMDPNIEALLDRIVSQVSGNPKGALAAIIELLNPVEYELEDMDWIEQGAWDYDEIEGANQMSIVYLNYGNDWTREDADYLVDNIDTMLASILDMVGVEMDDLGAYLQDMVNGLFTNANITALVEMLGGLGDSPSGVILDIVANQVEIDISSWFNAFGYLYPAETWAEDAEVVAKNSLLYVNNFGVDGIANEDGSITWVLDGRTTLVDGDGYTFINILTRLLGSAEVLVKFLLAGEDIKAFEDLLTVKGYETYDTSLGLLLTMLGVENLPTQADFNADTMGSLTNMLTATLDWFYALTDSDDMIAQLLELIPDVFYFIESNGLSTLLHNLLMPVLVLVDTVRPIFDVDINGLLSLIVSEFLNYGTLDLDVILQYLIHGIYVNDDFDFVYYAVDINNLTLSAIIQIVDKYIGTNLYESGLVQIGVKGLCSGVEAVEDTAVGDIYRTTVTAADAITIIITAFIDCLSYPAKDASKTNGDALFGFIAEMTENEAIADLYPAIQSILDGIVYDYDSPNWGYMFENSDLFTLDLPKQSIVYLGYTTDWDEETADAVYGVLDEVLELVLPEVLEEGETIATLINGLLEDNVYSDEILNTIVELLVNLLADFDKTLFDLVDCVVDTDISTWFTYCELDETTGEYVCTYDWGVDEAAEADKKDKFVAGIKAVLEPANSLLAWLFFGTEYAFFTSSEVDENGDYIYADLITLNGGEGYAYGLVPIFEALGCTMKPASDFYNAEKDTYNVGDAVESILNSVLALVDEISASENLAAEVFNLLPNLVYFINADGLVTSVNNLLAPVNVILEKLSPVISEDGEKISIGAMLEETVGFDICNITMETLLTIAVDNGIVLNDEMINILANLYVGKLAEFTSANGRIAYRLDVTGYEGDVLTIILSLALDLFNINAELFSDLLGEETYWTVYNLIKGASENFTYRDMNWAYMYEGEDAAEKLAALVEANGKLPERTNVGYDVYTKYQNNWNERTADYVTEVLDTLVHDITTAVRSDGSSLGMILDQAISDGLYQDSILNSLVELVVELLIDYEDLVAGAGALLGAEKLADWFDYCTITTDENGDTVVTCTHNWGIDDAETIDEKRDAFIDAFATVLEPAYDLLAWLFFAEDYTFLNGTTGENYGDPLITIKGGRGYEEALVPLFEAVGVLMKRDANGDLLSVEETYLNGESAVLRATAFYVDGELDMEYAVKTIFGAVSDWLYDICGDLADQGADGALTSMLERLPNLLYGINADGLKVVVNNLVAPVMYLLEALEPMIGEIDFNELIGIEGMDIFDFDFDDLFALLADEDVLGLHFPDYTQEFLKTFYIGELVDYTSANGETAYFMTYTEEESAAEMITCLIGFVVDAFQDPRNDVCLIDWMGEDVYNGIMAVLGLQGVKDMQDYSWMYTEYADTDYEFNATNTSVRYEAAYNNIWTRDKAEYIADNLVPFVSNILGLIGLEINGVEIRDVDDLLDSLLEGNLYTQATVDSLLETVRDLVSNLTSLEPYGEYITGILDTAFGVDLTAWDTMNLVVEDGNRDSFVAALEEMLAPVVPLLNVLLCGENIELFYSIAPEKVGESAVIIYGSEGYAYGIVPLLEALGCEMMDPESFKALSNEDKVGAILDSLLDRVDVILQDPVNEVFAMLPELIYFINSNGLDTAVNNVLNSVDTVLMALEPIVGATSLMELLGVDLAEFNFEYLINMACEAIEESTGLDVEPLIVDFCAELTMGNVVSYQSANGETYYKMVYAGENQLADMVTVLLRLAIDWLATDNNADAVIALLQGNAESEEAANSSATLVKMILQGLNTEPSTSGAMATVYYIFYGLNNGAAGLDTLYGNYGDSWDSLLKFFEETDDSTYDKVTDFLKNVISEFGGVNTDSSKDDCDCNCHSNSGFIRFFFKIANFFRRLFGMNEYQYCDCGEAHW